MNKRVALILFIAAGTILGAIELIAYCITLSQPDVPPSAETSRIDELILKNKALRRRISELSPKGLYIVIDTAGNFLYVREGERTLLKTLISSGSGNILRDPSGTNEWVFDTPRAEFEVKQKIRRPRWIRPDWAFIEEGEDLPTRWEDRVQEGVLGDYALGFGNGYFIHGTLYTRLLGRNVTHGCIRVGDKDLETLYRLSHVGTKIYIF
jgi:lipoprotein-anchoring transpeptidase ErfK/SrfK